MAFLLNVSCEKSFTDPLETAQRPKNEIRSLDLPPNAMSSGSFRHIGNDSPRVGGEPRPDVFFIGINIYHQNNGLNYRGSVA